MVFKKTKKGLLPAVTMVELFLFILAFLSIFGVIILFINSGTKAGQEAVCRDSVMLRGKAEIDVAKIFTARKFTPLICDPIDAGELKGSREELKYQISELSAKCWWMFAEGIFDDLFKDDKGEVGCRVCYYFTLPENFDLGETSKSNRFPETRFDKGEEENNSKVILSGEIYNFMLGTHYNPKLLYGGGTKDYVGYIYPEKRRDALIKVNRPKNVNLRDVETVPVNGVQDYTTFLTIETQTKISQFSNKVYSDSKGSGALVMVLVADELHRNDRSDARRLIERLKMNSEKDIFDAILITISLQNDPSVRIHMGSSYSNKIPEFELGNILEARFSSVFNEQTLNIAIQGLIDDLDSKLFPPKNFVQETFLDPKSFYAYLSNEGETMPVLDHLTAGRTYVVAYASKSAIETWWKGIKSQGGATTGIVIGVGIAATIIITGGTATPIILGAILAGSAAGTTVASTLISETEMSADQSFYDGLKALAGNVRTSVDKNNKILITRAAYVEDMCRLR